MQHRDRELQSVCLNFLLLAVLKFCDFCNDLAGEKHFPARLRIRAFKSRTIRDKFKFVFNSFSITY